MRFFKGVHHDELSGPCALTVGTFDGVHRGHQVILALLCSEARQRGLPACVVTFEPHPREFFASKRANEEGQPPRISTLRDKLMEFQRCGVDRVVVLRFDDALASRSAADFIDSVMVRSLNAKYVLVGENFRFGANRTGDYATLDVAGVTRGFDVARVNSYEVHGLRIGGPAVRAALTSGRISEAEELLGRPYTVSGRVVHGAKLGRTLGFRTLNVRFPRGLPSAQGIFIALVRGLGDQPLQAVASLGRRPTVEKAGRVLLEAHCLSWPRLFHSEQAYGKLVSVELLEKIRDEQRFDGLAELAQAIDGDVSVAREFFRTRPSRPALA